MAKIKKRKRRNPPTVIPKVQQPRGFDYGCLPYALAVGSFEFPGQLSAASVDGVAYGFAWCEAVHQRVPTISLVGKHALELAKAFETFNAWSKQTDPDSVEITFVFRKIGGYVLALSAEPSRLERRCLGFGRTHKPVAFAPTWFKSMDSINPFLPEFRQYCAGPIAPFLFDGVVYHPNRALNASSPPDVHPIPRLEPLLKFDVAFVDEDDVTPNTIGSIALRIDSPSLDKSRKRPPAPVPEDAAQQRIKTLRHHFPVTLERLRRSSTVRQLMHRLRSEGAHAWQIEQALCNLVLSADMGHPPHYRGLSSRKVQTRVTEALASRYELADAAALPNFSADEVRTQLVADGNALLRYFRAKSAIDLPALQTGLQLLSLLEAPTAISASSAEWTAAP